MARPGVIGETRNDDEEIIGDKEQLMDHEERGPNDLRLYIIFIIYIRYRTLFGRTLIERWRP